MISKRIMMKSGKIFFRCLFRDYELIAGKMAADDEIFRTSDAASADFAAELGSIDFATIIGGPLDACVKAQSNVSIATVNFINEVGLSLQICQCSQPKKLRMAEFKYKKYS
jgi:hypothetical protein